MDSINAIAKVEYPMVTEAMTFTLCMDDNWPTNKVLMSKALQNSNRVNIFINWQVSLFYGRCADAVDK